MITAVYDFRIFKTFLVMLIVATVCATCLSPVKFACAAAQKAEDKATKAETTKRSAQKTTDKRKEIVSEAVSTLRETQDALKLLDDGKSKEALYAVERATGKLEIILAAIQKYPWCQ